MVIMKRKFGIFLFVLVTPVLVGFMLNLMTGISSQVHTSGVADLNIQDIRTVPLCGDRADFDPMIHEDCLSVGYGFIGDYKSVTDPHYDRYH